MLQKSRAVPIFLFASVLVLGCGDGAAKDQPELADVTGIVTVDGHPMENLQVTFIPEEGRPSQGVTDSEGRYTLHYIRDISGAKIGNHKVSITPLNVSTSDRIEDNQKPQLRLPPKYNTQTTLTAQVKEGENTMNFPLSTTN